MVRVTGLVGVLALGITAAFGLVRLQQLESVAPGRATAQSAGKWTSAAPLLLRSEADAALTRDFPEQLAEVVEGTGFFRSPNGFTARVLAPETVRGALEAADAALSARGGLRLELPGRGDGTARLSLPAGLALKVRELGAEGEGRQVQGAVAYGRSGGTSYWRTTNSGYEEWVLVAAAGEGPVAEWEVQGGQLKQDGEDVLVADASGQAQLRVTAPKAYRSGGQKARAWLRAEGNVIALYTSARGRTLVDPLWTTTGSMATAREYATATLLPSGKVLVAGGRGASLLASAELYDPATGTWSATGSMSTARFFHTATMLASGKVLVAGGLHSPPPPLTFPPVASAELFDPATGTWSATGSMTTGRTGHTATLLTSSGKVLVAGGHSNTVLSSAELYDPATGTWSSTASMTTGRNAHTATLLTSSGKVLVAGGTNGTLLASAELYDSTASVPAISPSMVTVAPGQSQTFTASGGSGAGYTWALTINNSGGNITSAGVYTAGNTGGVTDVVQVTDSASATSTATVTVSPRPLAVSPSSVTLAAGAMQTFTASGGSGTGYTWALTTNKSGGNITSAGVYTAGSTGGVTDVVQVTDSASATSTATVTVTPPSESGGCGTTVGGALPLLALAVLPLLVSRRRRVAPGLPRRC